MAGRGEISVHIETSSKKIRITISDTGKGIEKRLTSRFLDPDLQQRNAVGV